MFLRQQDAFTMLELIFSIVIIATLATVAIPKFSTTRNDAIMTKAKTTLASARSGLSIMRQKRILQGNFSDISMSDINHTDTEMFIGILEYPTKKCSNTERSCWTTNDTTGYIFRKPDGTNVKFELNDNRIKCKSPAESCNFFR